MNRPRPIKLGAFKGVNNRAPDHALPDGYVRDALNLDLKQTGTLARRDGYQRVLSGVDCHSAWSGEGGSYYVDGRDLISVQQIDGVTTSSVIFSGIVGKHVSYTDTPLGVVWTDGFQLRRASGLLTPPTPNPVPSTTAGTGGSLAQGTYILAFSSVAPDGVESALSAPIVLDVAAQGSITIGTNTGSYDLAVYLQTPGDEALRRVGTVVEGGGLAITVKPSSTGAEGMLGISQMPAGSIVRYTQGRLLVATGNVLHYSEAYAFGLYKRFKNFVQIPGEITLVEPVADGFYIANEDTTWFYKGEIGSKEAAMARVAEHGAIRYTSIRDDMSDQAWWFTPRGLVAGMPGGSLELAQDADVAIDYGYVAGATMLREANGLQQVVGSLFGGDQSVAAARSYIEAEVVRRGTEL